MAEDFVYSIKRLLDPKLAAPLLAEVEGYIVGSDEALAKARKANKFDYDAPIEGLKAIDRYTWQIKLTKPFYTFIYTLSYVMEAAREAWEVVEQWLRRRQPPGGHGPYRAVLETLFQAGVRAQPEFPRGVLRRATAADDKGRRS